MARISDLSLHIECQLDDEYFADWELLPQRLKDFWLETEHTCNCEGSGNMGIWGVNCPFWKTEVDEL